MTSTQTTFEGLGIAPKLLEALNKLKYVQPTPIQAQAIPVAMNGEDVIGIAQTGTGKTLAFSIPMIQRISQTKQQGLIIAPTRELALQIEEELQKIARQIGLRTAVLIGGASMGLQLSMLRQKPHVIIATPGRLIDHLNQRTVNLTTVNTLVLDEADRMLDMGFAPQINRILETVSKERQTMLFSATMPPEILKLARTYMHSPTHIEIARAGTSATNVSQELYFIGKEDKIRLLEHILEVNKGTVLVFSRTKHGAKKICKMVQKMGHTSAELHSDRSLAQRRGALEGFKRGTYRVLVATDIAARGIDVKEIALVVNFDLPDNPDDYVHRIGRTGRAGASGMTISFATPDQKRDVRTIESLIRKTIPQKPVPGTLPAKRALPAYTEDAARSYAPRSYGGQRSYGGASSSSSRDSRGRGFSGGYGGSKTPGYGYSNRSPQAKPTNPYQSKQAARAQQSGSLRPQTGGGRSHAAGAAGGRRVKIYT